MQVWMIRTTSVWDAGSPDIVTLWSSRVDAVRAIEEAGDFHHTDRNPNLDGRGDGSAAWWNDDESCVLTLETVG